MNTYENFLVELNDGVAHVSLNCPEKANALDKSGWAELKAVFEEMDETPAVRAVVLSGEGKHFCAGIDLNFLMTENQENAKLEEGRKREKFRRLVLWLQDTVSAIERCRKPVLAAIHKGCLGGGIDIITACDMRYCTEDAYFSVKEIDMAIVADLGTLQRLPTIVGQGIAREMAFTGRKMFAPEAKQRLLVNEVYADKETMLQQVIELAKLIAAKSPLTMRGTKEVLNHSRDHGVYDSLQYVATWNSGMLFSEDLMKAVQAAMTKQAAEFKD